MTLTKDKFRKNCIQTIKGIAPFNKIYLNNLLNNLLLKELKNIKNKKILFYYPLPFEANITKSMYRLRKKCDIFLPFMEGESFKMVPLRLPFKKKKFSIYEAGNTIRKIKNIDIAIVPVIGVDGHLQRIGFGKGMYDRFFEKLDKKPYTIFVQLKLCHTKEFVCDDYDIECDLLLTPKVRLVNTRKK